MSHLDPLAARVSGADGQGVAERVAAVVLAGGTSSRLGGADKASIELDGVTLLERALAATMTAMEVVVLGDQVPTTRPVTWTMEDPRGGGPAAGLLTGLVVLARSGARPAGATALAALGALLGSVLAVALGQLLGPDPLAEQRAASPGGGGLTSPLVVHAPGVVLVWPAVALAVSAVGHALLARAQGRAEDRAEDRAPEGDPVAAEDGSAQAP